MIYLASPYSHPDPEVRHERFVVVCRAAAKLMASEVFVFCPIAHTHPIALYGNMPGSFAYWEAYDRYMLNLCDSLVVLMLPGWEESLGVQSEIRIMREANKPVTYIEPD